MVARLTIFCFAAALGIATSFISAPTPRHAVASRGSFIARSPATRAIRPESARSGAAGLKALTGGEIDATTLHQVFQGLADATAAIADATASGADQVVAAAAADNGGGVFGQLVSLTESAITGLHVALNGLGIENSYGLSIIGFTLFVKALTFPLTYKQLASTTKMQVLQPKVKDIQKRLGNDPEAANKAIADLYKQEEINPLSGCLPTLAQIPIFISLYRALLNLAKENALNEPFLWLPSLEGPVFGAPPAESLNWIKVWNNGVPSLGWHDTLCYLSIPVILVITQSVSQQLMQPPKKPGAETDTSQAILKYLPLLIGWFSLNVPSGLGVYWIINNFVSTATSVFIRNQLAPAAASAGVGSDGASSGSSGINGSSSSKPGSTVQDAEVVKSVVMEEAKGFGPTSQSGDNIDGEIIAGNDSVKPNKSSGGGSSKKSKSRKGGKKK